MEGWEIGNES